MAARRHRKQRQRPNAARAARTAAAVCGIAQGGRVIVPRTVIGARFMKAGRMYFFETGPVTDVDLGETVIVRTELGDDAAPVAILPTDARPVVGGPPLGTVARRATGADVFAMNKHKRMEEDATRTVADMVR